jgi:hypothetical protein
MSDGVLAETASRSLSLRLFRVDVRVPVDHHRVPGPVAPADFFRWIGIGRTVGRVVKVRDAFDRRSFRNRKGLEESVSFSKRNRLPVGRCVKYNSLGMSNGGER